MSQNSGGFIMESEEVTSAAPNNAIMHWNHFRKQLGLISKAQSSTQKGHSLKLRLYRLHPQTLSKVSLAKLGCQFFTESISVSGLLLVVVISCRYTAKTGRQSSQPDIKFITGPKRLGSTASEIPKSNVLGSVQAPRQKHPQRHTYKLDSKVDQNVSLRCFGLIWSFKQNLAAERKMSKQKLRSNNVNKKKVQLSHPFNAIVHG
ncbi:hypothetical protein TorRG33x02_112630 [Trema orientale]|uniref:Uncharacterized protein n=1 Tax=Trema orientale TaxID=63057 RepID=A0A2P5F5C7_TREOI|nr:hypothetical protein TorRG33x02_112630 [Trema orientale]